MEQTSERLLTVTGLTTEFSTERGIVKAVNNVSYYIDGGEILGIVGESGCGKSVSQLSLMQLVPTPPGRIIAGTAEFMGVNLLKYGRKSKEMCSVRGRDISMIFQEPMTSLNPAITIGRQMAEVLMTHLDMGKTEALEKSADMLDFLIPRYIKEGKNQLVVSVGCTGGKHRSVVFAEQLAEHLRGQGLEPVCYHRNI